MPAAALLRRRHGDLVADAVRLDVRVLEQQRDLQVEQAVVVDALGVIEAGLRAATRRRDGEERKVRGGARGRDDDLEAPGQRDVREEKRALARLVRLAAALRQAELGDRAVRLVAGRAVGRRRRDVDRDGHAGAADEGDAVAVALTVGGIRRRNVGVDAADRDDGHGLAREGDAESGVDARLDERDQRGDARHVRLRLDEDRDLAAVDVQRDVDRVGVALDVRRRQLPVVEGRR